MIRGLNTNIKRNGRIYHIQTEDSGVRSAFITAHLFLDGAVLAAVRTDYADIAGLPEEKLTVEVAERMRKAHRQMITRLTSGDFDEKKKNGRTAVKADSEIEELSDDSSLAEKNDAETNEEEGSSSMVPVSNADFQALLEYDDDDEYEEISLPPVKMRPVEKNENVSEPEEEEILPEPQASMTEKPLAGMSRTERVAAILRRFDEFPQPADFSVSERIRMLLDGDDK